MKKHIFKDFLAVLILSLIILTFLWRGVINQGVFFEADEIASDLLHHAYPYHEFFAADYLKKGKFPLWNPYIGSGTPIFGEAQTGVYNPISGLLYLFFDPKVAFNWLIISSFLFIGVGTYFYSKSLGLPIFAVFLSGLVFSLSGFMVGHLRHAPLINAIAFMPLMFLVVEKIIFKPKLLWAGVFGFLIFLSFSTGQLATTYLLVFVIIFYFLARIWFEFKKDKEENPKAIGIFFLGLILGILISSAVLLPALEMASYSTRASFNLENSLSPEYKLKYLWMFINPFAYGDPSLGTWNILTENFWENIGYIGILPLLLALFGIYSGLKQKNIYIKSTALVLVICLILLLGSTTFFYNLIRDWVPGFVYTRVSGRFLLFIDFFLSILAGFGIKNLISKVDKKKWLIILVVIILTMVDLFHFGFNFNTVIQMDYFAEPQTVKFLKKDPDLFRIRSLDFGSAWYEAWKKSNGWRGDLSAYMLQREILPPDYNLLFRIFSPSFIYGLAGHYGVKKPSELDEVIAHSLNDKQVSSRSASLLGMENVKYLLSSKKIDLNEDFKQVRQYPSGENSFIYIYENLKNLPRAFFVSQAIYKPSEQILNSIYFGVFDPSKEVILEQNLEAQAKNSTGSAQIKSYQDNFIEAEVTSSKGGFLVLSDTYYPGWKVFIDNIENQIFQANYAYRAVKVEKGTHQVVFKYQPNSVKWGISVSLVSFGLFIVALGLNFALKKR